MPPNGLSVFFLSRAAISDIFSNKCPSTIDTMTPQKNPQYGSSRRTMKKRHTFVNNEDLSSLPAQQCRARSSDVTEKFANVINRRRDRAPRV